MPSLLPLSSGIFQLWIRWSPLSDEATLNFLKPSSPLGPKGLSDLLNRLYMVKNIIFWIHSDFFFPWVAHPAIGALSFLWTRRFLWIRITRFTYITCDDPSTPDLLLIWGPCWTPEPLPRVTLRSPWTPWASLPPKGGLQNPYRYGYIYHLGVLYLWVWIPSHHADQSVRDGI